MAISISANGKTVYGPRITRDSLMLYLDAANTKSVLGRRTLINWANWTTGSGGVSGYNQNGQTIENERVVASNPWGVNDIVWESRPSGNGNDDGGWNTDWFNIDRTKLYRFSVWVRRTSSTTGGTFYLGMYANGDGSRRTDNSAVEGNAYWECSGTGVLTQNQWYLWVGHVYPSDTAYTGRHPDTGYYTTTGGRVGNINGCNIGAAGDLKWSSNSTQGIHRTYHYYCNDSTTRLQFYQPRVDLVDGTEPTIVQLLQDAGSYWYDLSGRNNNGKPTSGTYYSSTDGGSIIFDGVDDYIDVANAQSLNAGYNSFSIDCWVKQYDTGGNGIVEARGDGLHGFLFILNYPSAGYLGFFLNTTLDTSQNTYASTTADFSDVNTWMHVAVVVNRTSELLTFYKNGVQAGTTVAITSSGTIDPGATYRYWVGGDLGGPEANFTVSSIRHYSRVLSATEILQNYNAHKERFGLI